MRVRFGVLGPLEVVDGATSLELGGPKLRTLLAALLVEANRTVPIGRLAAALWPSKRPADEVNALQTQVSRLRSVIDPAAGPGDRRLAGRAGGYRLRVDDGELDAATFEAHRRRSSEALRARDWLVAVEAADAALACWRGRAFEQFAHEEFAAARAAQLEELRLETIEERAEAALALGRHRELAGDLDKQVAENPLRERLWCHLILALYRSGRQGDALRAYQRIRTLLAEELGIQPCAELVRLERAVLDQDESLDWRHAKLMLEPSPAAVTTSSGAGVAATAAAAAPAMRTSVEREMTFLFTDVENSPALWDNDPAAMTEALRAHDTILYEAIERRSGHVFSRSGEGFCAAFERAADALASAIDGQRQFPLQLARSLPPLRVQMAVHSGNAALSDGRYIGVNVNRVARLRDAAHGGQVLVTTATRELARDSLPAGAALTDIGRWTFEGLSRSERLYRLDHADLEHGFPPPRSGRRHTGRVPRHLTSFVGRLEETDQTVAALRDHVLVTITGDGGIGKTRLALEVAHRADVANHPDGTWFCDLAAVEDADGMVEAIATALGIATPTGANTRSAVLAAMQNAHMLVLLDNCERLVPEVATLLDEILRAGPAAKVLTTSRVPLRVAGERVVQLRPLRVPTAQSDPAADAPALQLLVDRVTAAGAPVDLDDPALVEIVRRLEGVPLAIELAAPRLGSMSPGALAERLRDGLGLLEGPATVPTRHRTLHATVDWSFGLLSPPAQRLLGALATFRGGWTLNSAESIAASVDVESDAVATLVTELVDHSVISIEHPIVGAGRYQMLETVRAYTLDRFGGTELQSRAAEAHALHFIELAEEAAQHRRGPLEPAWVLQVMNEFDNFRTAFRWSVEADRPAEGLRLVVALAEDIMRARLEIGRWAEELIALPATAGHPLRPTAVAIAGHIALLEFRMDDALRLSVEALDEESKVGAAPSWPAHATMALLTGLGFVGGDFREPLRALTEISETTGDPLAAAISDFTFSLIAWVSREPHKSLKRSERLLATGIEHQNPTMLAMGLIAHGRAVGPTHPDLAARDFHDALAAASSAHSTVLVQYALRAIQELQAISGDRRRTLAELHSIVASFEQSGHIVEQLHTVVSMLDSLVALEAWRPLATICAALSTHVAWRLTPSSRVIEQSVSENLEPADSLAARRAGAVMAPADLVAYVSAVVMDLTAG